MHSEVRRCHTLIQKKKRKKKKKRKSLIMKWKTIMNGKQALKLSFDWYKFHNENSKQNTIKFSINQIKDYMKNIK